MPFVSEEEDGIVVAYLRLYVCTFECMYLDSTAAPPAIFLYNKLDVGRLDSTRFVDSTRLDFGRCCCWRWIRKQQTIFGGRGWYSTYRMVRYQAIVCKRICEHNSEQPQRNDELVWVGHSKKVQGTDVADSRPTESVFQIFHSIVNTYSIDSSKEGLYGMFTTPLAIAMSRKAGVITMLVGRKSSIVAFTKKKLCTPPAVREMSRKHERCSTIAVARERNKKKETQVTFYRVCTCW